MEKFPDQKKSSEQREHREVVDMTAEEFCAEYEHLMPIVAHKERKGQLDPDARPYRTMTDDERELLARDWRAFSRARGFSEEDIVEYARWYKLSGQEDDLPGAINDPWRRSPYPGRGLRLYIKHIEHALEQGVTLPPVVQSSYEFAIRQVEKMKGPQFGEGGSAMPVDTTPFPIDPPTRRIAPEELDVF